MSHLEHLYGLHGLRVDGHLLLKVVATRVIIAVADGGEGLGAEFAFVRFFAGVNAHVHDQVSTLVEGLVAPHATEARRKGITNVHNDIAALYGLPDGLFVLTLVADPLLVAGSSVGDLPERRGDLVVAQHVSVLLI